LSWGNPFDDPPKPQRGSRQPVVKPKPPAYFDLDAYTASLDPFTLARRGDAESSLYRWMEVVLGYGPVKEGGNGLFYEPIHRPMCDAVEATLPIKGREKRDFQQKECRLEPRGSLKSSIAKGAAMYLLVFDPNARELIASHKHDEAKKMLAAITFEYERNEIFRLFYGDWTKNADQWAADAIKVAPRNTSLKDPSIDTTGADISKTGGHYDWILVDDIQSRKNVDSETMREKVRTAVQEYFPQLATHGGIFIIGTRYHRQDVYGWLQQRREEAVRNEAPPEYLFNITVRRAWNDDGSLYYPILLNERFLAQQRIELEEYLFSVWYLNEPLEEGAKVFKKVDAHEKDFDVEWDAMPIIVLPNGQRRSVYATFAWDPAGRRGSTRSDSHGFSVNGCDSADVWWTLEASAKKAPLDEILLHVLNTIRRCHIQKLSIETRGGGMQGLYVDLIRPVLQNAGIDIPIEEWSPGNRDSKETNIKTLQPRWNQWRWWLRKGHCDVLKTQLENFPQGHDDVLDTMLQHKTYGRPAQPDDLDPLASSEGEFDAPEGNGGEQEFIGGPQVGLGTPDYSAWIGAA
jgi:hypothetical protein